MPRVTPVAVFVLLALGFLLSLGTFIVLGSFAHPAKDDYLSAAMFGGAGVWESIRTQYQMHNGRLLSALVMRFSPLQFHSFEGYKAVCTAFVILFAGSLFLFVNSLLKNRLHTIDRAAVFIVLYLCLHGALGNVAEHYYWLPAISCYGISALLFLALLQLLPKALSAGVKRSPACILGCAIIGFAIDLCAEPGAIMSVCALLILALKARRDRRLSVPAFLVLSCVFLGGFVLAALSPGNALRIATSPHGRSVLQTIVGAGYSMSGSLLRMLYFMIPAAIFSLALIKRANPGLWFFRPRIVLSAALIAGFWLIAELIAFYGIGGMAALRVRNSLVFLGTILSIAGIWHSAVFHPPGSRLGAESIRWILPGCALWAVLGIFMPGHPVVSGMQDLISGTAHRYDRDMKTVYAVASGNPGEAFLKVPPVRVIPASLYVAQPLILAEELNGWPWFNVKMSNYFGHERLYADSLAATPSSGEAFQQWIRERRTGVFD